MHLFNLFKKKENIISAATYYNNLININEINQYGYESSYANQEPLLYKIYGNARILNNNISILVISDTHNTLNEEEFKNFILTNNNYDICLLLGDFGYRDIPIILKYVSKDKIYALLGNHDNNYIHEYGLNNLNGKIITIKGIKILGIEGSFRYKPSKFPSFSQKESIEFLNSKEEADILVSHDTGFNSLSRNDPAHQGLFGITYYLYKNRVPYHIHGHIHNHYQRNMLNGTKEISVYKYQIFHL